ncbi:MAG: TonB family protein [Acidobacteria bacterium]|nr:TonB family protein [Acidobacteriota bacterium]
MTMDAVSQVLAVRHEVDNAGPMLGVSAVAHVVLAVAVFLVPAAWMGIRVAEEEPVMTVSLAGPVGPQTGGRQAESRQATQAVAPPTRRPEPVAPPTAKTPEMIEPTKAPPKKNPPSPVKQAPRDAPTRTAPSTGAEVRSGDALANTGTTSRVPFGGTASGAGGTGARIDVGTFCCPQYLAIMQERILRNWESKQQALGTTIVLFTVQRDGTLTDVAVERTSGNASLDFIATRAIRLTERIPPLPPEYTNPSLTVHLTLEYQR